MFGTWQPDHAIQYEGYTRFWSALLSNIDSVDRQNIIYLHNNIYNEWQSRFPTLKGIFNLYFNYNYLISVSQKVSEANCHNLFKNFGLDSNKFVCVNNIPDIDGIPALAKEPLESDLKGFIHSTPISQIFATLGRLSPEKNHELLLNAFAIVHNKFPQAKLLILGEGPLHATLNAQIARLGLKGAAWLAGQRSNPFPLLKASGCFVLSSKYEGAGMVLFEAMTLHKPIVATNIPGPQDILQACNYGALVKEDAHAMAQAMMQTIDGHHPAQDVNAAIQAYRKNALEQFYAVLQ